MKNEKFEAQAKRFGRSKKRLMKNAHKVAKEIVSIVGNYSIALSFALKFVYKYNKIVKKLIAEKGISGYFYPAIEVAARNEFKPESVAGVPTWAIEKDHVGMRASIKDILFFTIETKVIKETEKAIQIVFYTKNPKENFVDQHKMWVAKSILVA